MLYNRIFSSDKKEDFVIQRLLLFQKHRYEKIHMVTTSYLKFKTSDYRSILRRLLFCSRAYIVDFLIILLRKLSLLSAVQISLSFYSVHMYLEHMVQKNAIIIAPHFCFNTIHLIIGSYNLDLQIISQYQPRDKVLH